MTQINYQTRIKRQLLTGEPKTEYELQKRVSKYLNQYYPIVEYRVDLSGVNLSRAASGKMKAVNKRRAWHDLEIYNPSGPFSGLCIELKVAGTQLVMNGDSRVKKVIDSRKIYGQRIQVRESKIRKAGDWVDQHIEEQARNLEVMADTGRCAAFGVGLRNTLLIIEGYLNHDLDAIKEGMIAQDFERLAVYAES